jgi:hypothetical protein
MARLVTTKFKIHNAEQFIESLGETSATNLYLFIGKVQEWDDENVPPAPNEAVANTLYNYWDQMIAAKKVTSADVKHVITRVNWESNTAYTAYAHTNPDQLSNNFYVATEELNIYKCLQNNLSNGASTIKPTGTGTAVIEIADGSNSRATISVEPVSTYKFDTGFFASVTNSTVMQLSTSANNSLNDLYVNSTVFVVNNAGQGEQTTITQYDALLQRITVSPAFTVTPNTVSGYEVTPSISINGDGVSFKGRARGNATHGVTEIVVTQQGSDFTIAGSTIVANSSHGTGANATVIIGPVGGHGKNAIEELGGNRILIDTRISGNESGKFTTSNDFRQVGLLRDPLQTANTLAFFTESLSDQSTTLTVGGVAGSFQSDEKIFTGSSLENSTANGVVVDFLNNNTLRINEVKGSFVDSTVVTGANTSSTGTISVDGISQPGMKPYSGDVLYIENRAKITRLQNQVEDFKIVLEF